MPSPETAQPNISKDGQNLLEQQVEPRHYQELISDLLDRHGVEVTSIDLDKTVKNTIDIHVGPGKNDDELIEIGQNVKNALAENDTPYALLFHTENGRRILV